MGFKSTPPLPVWLLIVPVGPPGPAGVQRGGRPGGAAAGGHRAGGARVWPSAGPEGHWLTPQRSTARTVGTSSATNAMPPTRAIQTWTVPLNASLLRSSCHLEVVDCAFQPQRKEQIFLPPEAKASPTISAPHTPPGFQHQDHLLTTLQNPPTSYPLVCDCPAPDARVPFRAVVISRLGRGWFKYALHAATVPSEPLSHS